MKYRRKPEIVEAVQWWKEGDHEKVLPLPDELKKYWNVPNSYGVLMLTEEIEGLGKYLVPVLQVAPGDWILLLENGSLTRCPAEIFLAQFEPVGE